MDIKSAVKRLEGVLARRKDSKTMTFVIPYFRDTSQTERIKTQLIDEHGIASKNDNLLIFVIDFAMNPVI